MQRINILNLMKNLKIGGQEIFILRQAKYTDRNRFCMHIGYVENGPLGREIEKLDVSLMRYSTTTTSLYQRWGGKIPIINPFRLIYPVMTVVRYIKENKINIMQTNGVYSYIVGSIAARLINIPHVRIQGNIMSDVEPTLFRFFRFLLFPNWTDRFVAAIKIQVEEFGMLGVPREKICHIPSYGVDLNEFHPDNFGEKIREELAIPQDAIVVGQAARLVGYKHFDKMIEAARVVIGKEPETFFMIVGDGPERQSLERLAKELGVKDRVVFTGFRLDIPQVVAAFDIAVSLEKGSGGLSNWEAMASGKPLISTENELLLPDETGLLVSIDDIKGIANAIITLVCDGNERMRMGNRARQLSEERYDFVNGFVRKMEELYNELAGI